MEGAGYFEPNDILSIKVSIITSTIVAYCPHRRGVRMNWLNFAIR